MLWFLIGLINPICHAATNHIDKHLVDKHLKGTKVGSLVLFSSLFAIMVLPFIYIFNPDVIHLSFKDGFLLTLNGALVVFAYICYLHALAKDEASFITPLFQTIPIFGFVLGYFLLGETLSPIQIVGSIVIIIGGGALSFEITNELDRNKAQFKKNIIYLMLAASALFAINGVIFKFVTIDESNFWRSIFWDFLGMILTGIVIFAVAEQYRRQFLTVLKQNKVSIIALNMLNETLALLGEGALAFAVLLAPVALVQVVSGVQPVLVFLLGIVITKFFPKFGEESMTRHKLIQKIIGISVILLGTVLINLQ